MRPRRTLPSLFALTSSIALLAGLPLAAPADSGPPAAAGAVEPMPAGPPILGFGAERAAAERELEARFDAALHPEDLRRWMQRLSARPHDVGSPYDKDNAEFLAGLFRSWGYDTAIEKFDVLFPTPETRRLEMIAPTRFVAGLAEPPLAADPTSGQTSEQLPDLQRLLGRRRRHRRPRLRQLRRARRTTRSSTRRGIDVKGKIVIARYGGSWRGIKPKVAAEHGAVGCLIYSDPRDDGYFQGDVYPEGRLPQRRRRAARLRHGHAALSRATR